MTAYDRLTAGWQFGHGDDPAPNLRDAQGRPMTVTGALGALALCLVAKPWPPEFLKWQKQTTT